MKKWVSWLLMVLFIAGHYQMQQVLRLPFLIRHFDHHQRLHGSSLQDFYLEHYGGSERDQHDAPDDNKLPFKGQTTVFVPAVILPDPTPVLQERSFICILFTAVTPDWKDEIYRKHWQPPCHV